MPRPKMITRTFKITTCTYLEYDEKKGDTKNVKKDIVKPVKNHEMLLAYLREDSQPGHIPIKILTTEVMTVFRGMTHEDFYKNSVELENRNNKIKERKSKK